MMPRPVLYSRPRPAGDANPHSTHGKLAGVDRLIGRSGRPYMTRIFAGLFRLHIIHRGDAGLVPHDHPWWFVTFPLRSYVEEALEEQLDGSVELKLNIVRSFRFHYRPAYYAHRILGRAFPGGLGDQPYRVGMSLTQIDQMLEDRGKRSAWNKIVTLVIRGKVRHAWGYHLRTGWVPAKQMFTRADYRQ